MKTTKQIATVANVIGIDRVAGRMHVRSDAENGTQIEVLVNGRFWGQAVIQDGEALIIGASPLPEHYTYAMVLKPAKPVTAE